MRPITTAGCVKLPSDRCGSTVGLCQQGSQSGQPKECLSSMFWAPFLQGQYDGVRSTYVHAACQIKLCFSGSLSGSLRKSVDVTCHICFGSSVGSKYAFPKGASHLDLTFRHVSINTHFWQGKVCLLEFACSHFILTF